MKKENKKERPTEMYSLEEMKFIIPIISVDSLNRDCLDMAECIIRGEELVNGYTGYYQGFEFIYALTELVPLKDLLNTEVGQFLEFRANRDIPEEGHMKIYRTN